MNEMALPCDVAAERFVLGSVILDHTAHAEVFRLLTPESFSRESHRRIFAAMVEMDTAGETVDRITISSKLKDSNQLESVGGFSYLVDLDNGLPEVVSIESYIDILREKCALRKIVYAAQHLAQRCMVAGSNSAELIGLADQTLMQIAYKADETAEILKPGEVVEKAGGIDKFLRPDPGVRTPWTMFTEKTGGFRRGEMFIMAGNTSMGKSAAALQIAMRVAEDNLGAMYFSLEMSRESLVRRMACMRARVDAGRLRVDHLNNDERGRLRKALNDIANWPLWIIEHGISTVSAIRAGLRTRRSKQDIFMVVIDYLQLLQSVGNKTANRNAEISEITRQLKLLAADDQVNVQLLSQLNRENMKERRAPALHDLRESGSIEQDADAVAFVWRPEMLFRDREDLHGLAELILAKQRNGPTGKIDLIWEGQYTTFQNRAEEFRDESQ